MSVFRKILSIISSVIIMINVLPLSAAAAKAEKTSGPYQYSISDGSVEITKYQGNDSVVRIPAQIDGMPVTAIGDKAFQECAQITEVTFPDTLTSIGTLAFAGCAGLTGLRLPDSVVEIGSRAFTSCTGLTHINYPLSLHDVFGSPGGGLFLGCSQLTSITVPEGVTVLPDEVFRNADCLQSVALPSTLTEIGNSAFNGCTSLKEVSLPDSLTTIGGYAFRECTQLKEITLPDTLTSIGMLAFAGCEGFTEIHLPDSVVEIGSQAFAGCIKLTQIHFPLSLRKVFGSPNGSGRGGLFLGCTQLTGITVPEGVTVLPDNVFRDSASLQSIPLPSTLTEIGDSAFNGCTALETLQIPQNVTTIGQNAFQNTAPVTLHCELNSMATVYAIRNSIAFIASDTGTYDETNLLNHRKSRYSADTSGVKTNGYITMHAEYSVPQKAWDTVTNGKINLYIPKTTKLVESSLRVNGNICTDYRVDDHVLTIPVTGAETTVAFNVKQQSQGNILSYAILSYQANGQQHNEVIGIVQDSTDPLTSKTD